MRFSDHWRHTSVLLLLSSFYFVKIDGVAILKDVAMPGVKGSANISLSYIDEKKKQLDATISELATLEAENGEVSKSLTARKEELDDLLDRARGTLEKDKGPDFAKRKIALLEAEDQAIADTQLAMDGTVNLLREQKRVLEEYLDDPQYESLKVGEKAFYGYQDFKLIRNKIWDCEDRLASTQDEKNKANFELELQKKNLAAVEAELKEKKKELESFVPKDQEGGQPIRPQDQAVLLELAVEVLQGRKQAAEKKVYEASKNLGFWDSKLFVAKRQLDVLKKEMAIVQGKLRVDEATLVAHEEKYENDRWTYLEERKKVLKKIDSLSRKREEIKNILDKAAAEAGVKLGELDLGEWGGAQPQTITEAVKLAMVNLQKESLFEVDSEIEWLKAYDALGDAKISREKESCDIIRIWHKITFRRFKSDSEITAEKNKFETAEAGWRNKRQVFLDKRASANRALAMQSKALRELQQRRQELSRKVVGFVLGKEAKELAAYRDILRKIEAVLASIGEKQGRLIETYSSIIEICEEVTRELASTSEELGSIWRRSVHAIPLSGIAGGLLDDFDIFFRELRGLANSFFKTYASGDYLKGLVVFPIYDPLGFMWFILVLLIMVLLFLGIRRLIRSVVKTLSVIQFHGRAGEVIRLIFLCILNFIHDFYVQIYVWLALLVLIKIYAVDVFPYVVFYGVSIPYLIYYLRLLVRRFYNFNMQHGYLILSKHMAGRFTTAFATLLYSTVAIQLFRELYLITSYQASRLLPSVLMALNFLILQVCLISLISKRQVLNAIHGNSKFAEALREKVEDYYYLIVIFFTAIIIMSNPYIGYGTLVFYVLLRVVVTLGLIRLLLWGNQYLKNVSSYPFFYYDGETTKERFPQAKTWYGVTSVFLFLLLTFIGILVALWVWGHDVSLRDLKDFLINPIMPAFYSDPTKQFSIAAALEMLAFVVGAMMVSYLINKFILKRVFSLLLVDAGVQNTVYSLTRYTVMAFGLLLGFVNAGLSNAMTGLWASLVAFGFLIRDPLGDFVAYFIILVQRPMKIGDYVMLDSEVRGVVRKFTPRTVILRRKDSYTIFVPNSKFLGNPFRNWSYTRSYFAFDDINVIIPYYEDPRRVREALIESCFLVDQILRRPSPVIRIDAFEDNGYRFIVRAFISPENFLDMWKVAGEVRIAIIETFHKRGIRIATPIRKFIVDDASRRVLPSKDNDSGKDGENRNSP